MPEFRQQAAYYLKGIPRAAKTRAKVNAVMTQQEVIDILDDFVDQAEVRLAEKAAHQLSQGA
ncbi:tRNA dihydrouridine synthase B [Agrilactobacillus composti DSM 18527 = JCM 14202]|nr:tRNA dihydrouridine synthase B [Agrilactobacillus composti DSM 18527 = JCM 14202]